MNKFVWFSWAVVLLANLSFCSIAVADKIESIEVIGNQRIEKETIISKLGVSTGDELNPEKENDILLTLHYTKFFKDISLDFVDGKLTVKVQEAPLVTEVKLVNDSGAITQKVLLTMITIKAGDMLIDSDLQENITRLTEEYKSAGFFLVKVTSEIDNVNNGGVVLTFKITEGPRVFIKKILFVGNDYYSDKKLSSVILCKEKSWSNFASPLTLYNVMYIENDKELLQQFYRNSGFMNCNISSSVELSPAKDSVVITYIIDEDKRFYLGELSLETSISSINSKELSKFLKVEPNTLFNSANLHSISQKITDVLQKQGLYQVRVYPKFRYRADSSSVVDVVFVIDFDKGIYIRNINISGNTITQDNVIRREIDVIEGDALSERKLETTKKNISMLSFIDDVSISMVPVTDSDYYDVLVKIKEGRNLRGIGLSGGYNSITGLTGSFSFSWDNIMGTGRLINGELSVAKKSSSQSISIIDPNFNGRGFVGKLHLFHFGKDPINSESTTRASIKKYKGEYYSHNVFGASFEVDRKLTEHFIGTLGYTIKTDKGETVSDEIIQQIYGEKHDFIYSIIDGAITYNRTDNFRRPKNGYLMRYGVSFSGLGGTVKYLKNTVMAKFFKSFLDNKVTFMFVTRFNNIRGALGEEVKVYDLLKVSQDHLRGFTGIGPKIQAIDLRIGGTNSYTASAELFVPIGLPDELNARGSIFMDIGSVWGGDNVGIINRVTDSEKFNLRASIGIGLTFDIIGQPIKFFYAVPIKRENYDEVEKLGFTLGFI
ncbi:outer membrane protein assembly factor BamA [Orientia tsutsugamushi str. Gilliam]|uniref:Outer membrane protein assembly factor BamA n=1 Tax=Orientia tsutsugamushi str. Gilliam TaxID=1359184 RepID=A0A2U3QU77_ORITS|nr:outer membrane protein assembly factor BamA [Orientia tsutsugamushi]SPR04516.1 outer membrane protein assembly factor BamA [Orientia tsutsugamushi str. Gilliam]